MVWLSSRLLKPGGSRMHSAINALGASGNPPTLQYIIDIGGLPQHAVDIYIYTNIYLHTYGAEINCTRYSFCTLRSKQHTSSSQPGLRPSENHINMTIKASTHPPALRGRERYPHPPPHALSAFPPQIQNSPSPWVYFQGRMPPSTLNVFSWFWHC